MAKVRETTVCPGCGLELPRGERGYDRKVFASAECWWVFEQVIAAEFQNASLFGRAHQLTVDAYAVQHARGKHPDKSVCIPHREMARELAKDVVGTVARRPSK